MAKQDRYELIKGSGLMAPAHSPQLWAGIFVGVPEHHRSLLTKLKPFARRFLVRYPQYSVLMEDRDLTSAMLVYRLNALYSLNGLADRENSGRAQEILGYRSDSDPERDLRVTWLLKDPGFDRPYWGGWKQAAFQHFPDMTRRSSFVDSLANPGLRRLDDPNRDRNGQATIEPRTAKAADALDRRAAGDLDIVDLPAKSGGDRSDAASFGLEKYRFECNNPEAAYLARLDCERTLRMLQKSVQEYANAHGSRKNAGMDALKVFGVWQTLRTFYPDIDEIREWTPDNSRNKWKTILRLIEKPLADVRQQLGRGGYSPLPTQFTSEAGD